MKQTGIDTGLSFKELKLKAEYLKEIEMKKKKKSSADDQNALDERPRLSNSTPER